MSDWLTMDTAPRDGTRILLCKRANPRGGRSQKLVTIGRWTRGEIGNTYWTQEHTNYVAQDRDLLGWMLLPEPPALLMQGERE